MSKDGVGAMSALVGGEILPVRAIHCIDPCQNEDSVLHTQLTARYF
jgi:hypothetical protein